MPRPGTRATAGYRSRDLSGWSLEVRCDPTTSDHVSEPVDANVDAPVVWTQRSEMKDGNWHRMSVHALGTWITVDIDAIADGVPKGSRAWLFRPMSALRQPLGR